MQRAVADKLSLLPVIRVCLRHKHVGVRYAACQSLRSLSRSTELMRTNIADSDVGMIMFEEIFMKADEDRRVINAALMAVCNLFNGFSPLRLVCNIFRSVLHFCAYTIGIDKLQKYLEKGADKRVIELFNSGDPSLRLNALWALKNLLSHPDSEEEKARIMELLTWERFVQSVSFRHLSLNEYRMNPPFHRILEDPDTGAQEQAWHMLRNFVNTEQGINVVFNKLGTERLLGLLSITLQRDEDIMLQVSLLCRLLHPNNLNFFKNYNKQATYVLANLCNGDENHLHAIVSYPAIIPCLERCLASSLMKIRRPAISCVAQLFRYSNIRRIVLRDGGIVKALRYIRDWSVDTVSLSPGGGSGVAPVSAGVISSSLMTDTQGEARDVRNMARDALSWLEV
jgi:armadillo repeat-containing protein 8